MASTADNITERLLAEIERVPIDRCEALLTIGHAYREAVDDEVDPAKSIRRGLADSRSGQVRPIDNIWEVVEYRSVA